MKRLHFLFALLIIASGVWARRSVSARQWDHGRALLITALRRPDALLPAVLPGRSALDHLRLTSSAGKPKIVYSFNPDDDLDAIRRAGFTHVVVSYLQYMPDEAQRRKLDEFHQHGLKVIYRIVDLVVRDREAGRDELVPHVVHLLRDHPALAAWQTFEETNLPAAPQIAVYKKIKQWDPDHPVITVITNEYTTGWYQRTYSDDAQDIVMIDFYPYKKRYNGWVYIPASMVALRAAQHRPVPIIPVIQVSSSTGVASAEDTIWPPPGGLEKQLNLWWSLGADAGAAFWLWRGSKEYPFVGIADSQAPAYALRETKALLARIPDGELPYQTVGGSRQTVVGGRQSAAGKRQKERPGLLPTTVSRPPSPASIPAARIWQPRENFLKNSGFERGLEGWSAYSGAAVPSDQAFEGHGAARLVNEGAPKPMGIGQGTDLLVPPNETATLSCYYRVLQPTTRLQWMIGTTAYPKFGAASFLEGKERLPTGNWQRTSISVTNATGAPQRVTSISVLSNAFTGDVLLDNFQLELSPHATPTTVSAPDRPTRLVYHLGAVGKRNEGRATEWTLSAWSAPAMPPTGGDYACLAAIEGERGAGAGRALELRLRVDPGRSDPYGWAGALEVARASAASLRLPLALAPGQPLFWALSGTPTGALTLRAAPAGYRLTSASTGAGAFSARPATLFLGADAAGAHALNGLTGGARFTPQALSLPAAEQVREAEAEAVK